MKKEKWILCDYDGIPLEDYIAPYETYWVLKSNKKKIKKIKIR